MRQPGLSAAELYRGVRVLLERHPAPISPELRHTLNEAHVQASRMILPALGREYHTASDYPQFEQFARQDPLGALYSICSNALAYMTLRDTVSARWELHFLSEDAAQRWRDQVNELGQQLYGQGQWDLAHEFNEAYPTHANPMIGRI